MKFILDSIRPHKDLGILRFGFRDPLLTTTLTMEMTEEDSLNIDGNSGINTT
ncbi:hypothetical protein AALO_G00019650 [Alosa alosa]|uniref:Uncharacterized protein n=1 Tax=Alosa alosa TaxID=278164 RepID=A0AAV6HHK5_9TELE|nr:hypothetical protein AALO_G00019650 [Alosa alosa]